MSYIIRNFEISDTPSVKAFTDRCIGKDYFSLQELEDLRNKSINDNHNSSFLLINNNEVFGIRLTLMPGRWSFGKGLSLSEAQWPHKKVYTAYFQSQFIDPKLMRQGFARSMALRSIEVLQKIGAKGIVCHSWVESPGDASRSYLKSLGFQFIASYKNYWKEIDYICPRCGQPCLCTAEEMYLDLAIKK